MKKLFAIILVCALVLGLTGCDLKEMAGSAIKDLIKDVFSDILGNGDPEPTPTVPALPELIDLSGAEKVSSFYEDYYKLTGVTPEQAEGYVNTLSEAGYSTGVRHTLEECQDANFLQYMYRPQGFGNVYICLYGDTLLLGEDLHDNAYTFGEMWNAAGAPQELFLKDFHMVPEEEKVLLDWSAGTETMLGEYACRILTGVTFQQVVNYSRWLNTRGGYQASGYFDNNTIDNQLFLSAYTLVDGAAYSDYLAMAWYNGTAILGTIPGKAELDEYVFWGQLGAPVQPGHLWLHQHLIYIRPNTIGGGMGSGSPYGNEYTFAYGCTVEDFQHYKSVLVSKGFVEEVKEVSEDDCMSYTAAWYAPFGGVQYKVWYRLTLDGDYLEAELGFLLGDEIHKD